MDEKATLRQQLSETLKRHGITWKDIRRSLEDEVLVCACCENPAILLQDGHATPCADKHLNRGFLFNAIRLFAAIAADERAFEEMGLINLGKASGVSRIPRRTVESFGYRWHDETSGGVWLKPGESVAHWTSVEVEGWVN